MTPISVKYYLGKACVDASAYFPDDIQKYAKQFANEKKEEG